MTQILVDFDITESKSILPASPAIPTSIEVDPNTLASRIAKCVEGVSQSLRNLQEHTPGFQLGQVTFTLAITGSGEVSLLSLFKSSASMQSGIQITLQPVASTPK